MSKDLNSHFKTTMDNAGEKRQKTNFYHLEIGSDQKLQFLETNLLSNITTLTLSSENYNGHGKPRADGNMIRYIKCIGNAPSLQCLYIRHSVVDIDDLEELHKNNVQLDSLFLISSVIHVPNEYTLPTKIIPAINLRVLVLDKNSEIRDRNCTSMDYIIKKYTCLSRLEFLIRVVRDHYLEYAALLNDKFKETGQSYSNRNRVGSYDPRQDSINYFIDFYKKNGEQFLSNLPHSLQVLKLNTSIFKRPIRSLKEAKFMPTELVFYAYSSFSGVGHFKEIYDDIMDSAQSVQYFQGLPTLQTLSCSLGLDTKFFDGKMMSSSLKHLYIGEDSFASKKKLHLDKLFTAFPSLEILSISDWNCSVTASPATFASQITYPSFRLLKTKGACTNEAVDFMRVSLPRLKVLERMFSADILEYHKREAELQPIMHGCVDVQWRSRIHKKELRRYTIDLTGLDLDAFQLNTFFFHIRGELEANLYLKVESKEQIRAYSLIMTPGGFKDIKKASTTVETYDINVPNRITIKCDHIGTFKFNEYTMF